MKTFIYLLGGIAASILALRFLVVWLEPKLTFFPAREVRETPADYGFEYDQFHFLAEDGIELIGWKIPASGIPQADLLFFHGNAGNISAGRLSLLLEFVRRGYNVITFDYRGYGLSSGSPTEAGIYLDTEAFVRYYWEKLHDPQNFTLYFGRSLGGVTASRATLVQVPAALVLEGTFPDKATLLEHYPLPLRTMATFSKYTLNTIQFLENHHFPILVIHGDLDNIVPLPAGRALYERLSEPKKFYLIQGASHGDQHIVGGEEYWARLRSFTESLGS